MPKERNKADSYREKAYEGDMNGGDGVVAIGYPSYVSNLQVYKRT